MALTFNQNDPRFQRALASGLAKTSMQGRRLSRAEQGRIVGQHASRQMATGLEMQRLGLAQKAMDQRFSMAKARLEQADKDRALRRDALQFRKRLFSDEMADRKSNLRWSIGLGIGGLGLSHLEAGRRTRKLETEKAEREAFRDRMIKEQEANAAYRRKIEESMLKRGLI